MSTKTVLMSVLAQGGRVARYGEYTVVYMNGGTFVTSPIEYAAAQNWARGRMSCGNPVKDRSAFVDRIETVLARSGSGIATKGGRQALGRIVKNMTANAMVMEEWSIPRDLNDGVEIKRKPPAGISPAPAIPVMAVVAAVAAAAVVGTPVIAVTAAAVTVAALAVAPRPPKT